MKDSDIKAEMTTLTKDIEVRLSECRKIDRYERGLHSPQWARGRERRKARTSLLEKEIVERCQKLAKLEEHKQFNAHLGRASKIVEGWPDWWKQCLTFKQSPELQVPVNLLKGITDTPSAEQIGKESVPQYVERTRAEVEEERVRFVKRLNEGLAECHAEDKRPVLPPKVTVWTRDVSDEAERCYSWTCPVTGKEAGITIVKPASLSFHKGCTTHKVTKKNGTIIYVPAPGVFGCVVTVGVG